MYVVAQAEFKIEQWYRLWAGIMQEVDYVHSL